MTRPMALVAPLPATIPASSLPFVTAGQMADVDRLAIDVYAIALLQMMEQAGSHLAEVVRLELDGDLRRRHVVVGVGPGNNGGGGLVAARHLVNGGASVRVVLARPVLRMTEASRHQLATLVAMGADCCVATYDLADAALNPVLEAADVIVDAVLGYRAEGAPYGEVRRLIEMLDRVDRPVISLDLPSGIDADTGDALGVAMSASATLSLALPKMGLLRGEGAASSGRLYLGDLGLPAALYAELGIDVGLPFARGRLVLLDREH